MATARPEIPAVWSERVLATGATPLTDAECDEIVRILDRHGKGNKKEDEAVARVMMPQGAWRKLFKSFQETHELAVLVDSIFREPEPTRRAALIGQLYENNKNNKNRLTGDSGNVINALLAAYDPVNNLTVISLGDRRLQMEFLNLRQPFDWTAPIGQRIVQSNKILQDGTGALGVEGSARTKSCFWYYGPVKDLWKPEHTIKTGDNQVVSVSVPGASEAEEPGEANKEEIRESLKMQALLAEIGATMGFRIWLPRSDRTRILTKWKAEDGELLEELPLSFDRTLLKTRRLTCCGSGAGQSFGPLRSSIRPRFIPGYCVWQT